MLLAAILAATAPLPPPRVQLVTATVEIVAAEKITFETLKKPERGGKQRQHRVRDGMPLVEFY